MSHIWMKDKYSTVEVMDLFKRPNLQELTQDKIHNMTEYMELISYCQDILTKRDLSIAEVIGIVCTKKWKNKSLNTINKNDKCNCESHYLFWHGCTCGFTTPYKSKKTW